MGHGLVLNVAPVQVDDAEVAVGRLPFESGEVLRALRQKHYRTHVFRRDRDWIECVAVTEDAEPIGDDVETRRLGGHLSLAAALVRNALVNFLAKLGRQIEGFRPVAFVSKNDAENLLAGSLPRGSVCPPWLFVRPLFEMDVRVIDLDRGGPFVGSALNVRSMRRIGARCDELLRAGMDLRGLYVGRLEPNEDPRITPYLALQGRVTAVGEDGRLALDDVRGGGDAVPAAEVVLEPRNDAFHRTLDHVFGGSADGVRLTLDRRLVALRSGPGRLDRLYRVADFLGSTDLQIMPGVKCRFGRFLEQGRSGVFPTLMTAPKPVYVFDAAGSRTDTWSDGGLNKFGPYSADVFTPTRPRVCVICQATQRGQVDLFLHKFLHGVRPKGRGDRTPFASGLVRKYQLEGVSPEFFVADGRSAEAYRRAARAALERQQEAGGKWDLALVQVEEAFHGLHGEENPYLICKATFLSQQISVQEFEIETVTTTNETQLGYSLNNMALATYAKLGGVPWLIQSNRTIAHELVVGLGSASIGERRLERRQRVVGITTVFSGDGSYFLSNVSKAVPIEGYKDALLLSLRASVQRAQRSMNWQKRDHVRLVFHAFKPLKDAEVEAVMALMTELGDYDVDYAFIHVVEDHPYLLFDMQQHGVSSFGSRSPKGALAPTRGWFFRLSGSEILLCLTGARELKRAEDGMPWPVLLRLHRGSTFKDTSYLAKQMFVFSAHSWRSFFPSSLPVTVLYSELVAKLLGQMSQIPWWNPDAMLGRIGQTRWFL